MDKKAIDIAAVYRTVADTLPTEGRDFTLDTATAPDGSQRVVLTPTSAIGNSWAPHLRKALDATLGAAGAKTELAGNVGSETVTVASIRAKVEAEAAEALAAQIEANKADVKAKQAALAELKKKTPQASAIELRDAMQAAKAAEIYSRKLAKLSAKVKAVRDRVDASAKAAALADEENGQPWAIDMNAPLTTMFDREDATRKFRQKEQDILHVAQREIDTDLLISDAVAVAKQYILQKKA